MTDAEFNRILTCADPKPAKLEDIAMCKGSLMLGSGCGVCSRCKVEAKVMERKIAERAGKILPAETGTAPASRASKD